MVKWPRFGSCKTRLSKDIGKKNALKIQNKMLSHTLSVSKNVKERKIAEVRMAITGMGFNSSRRWCKDLGINNFCFQGKGCLGEKSATVPPACRGVRYVGGRCAPKLGKTASVREV